jgi:hypothetical protein
MIRKLAIVATLIPLVNCAAADPAQRASGDPSPAPLRICVLQDLTGSIVDTRTPKIADSELRALIDLIKERGGELGFGVIQERSDRGLARLAVGDPPAPPPPKRRNPWYLETWERARQQAEAARQRWEEDLETRVEAFVREVQSRLEAPLARATDVCGALRRGDLMLAEPSPADTQRFLVVISDGQHNVRRSTCPDSLAANARLLLVNGSAVQGLVERYEPTRFESIAAAIAFIQEVSK